MSDRIDELIARLAAAPPDHPLQALEGEISAAVSARARTEARVERALAPLGAASVGLALVLGLAVGGMTAAGAAAKPGHDAGAFSVAPALAPSTLLEGDR